jgi:CheY-like chemotaxis protein
MKSLFRATILVVEDFEDTREMMKVSLISLGYFVLVAENGRRGVEIATEHNPDIILMD